MQNAGQKVEKDDTLRGDRGEQLALVSDSYSGIDSVHSLYFRTDYPVGFMYIVIPPLSPGSFSSAHTPLVTIFANTDLPNARPMNVAEA